MIALSRLVFPKLESPKATFSCCLLGSSRLLSLGRERKCLYADFMKEALFMFILISKLLLTLAKVKYKSIIRNTFLSNIRQKNQESLNYYMLAS
jgi:hypothetical protein